MSLGATAAAAEDEDDVDDGGGGIGTRVVKFGQRVRSAFFSLEKGAQVESVVPFSRFILRKI
jgi:hypothetical protein